MAAGSARRLVTLGVALVGLLTLVALASRSHPSGGGGATHGVRGGILLEYALLALLVVSLMSAAIWVYSFRLAREAQLPARKPWMLRLLFSVAVLSLALALLVPIIRRFHHRHPGQSGKPAAAIPGKGAKVRPPRSAQGTRLPFDWAPVIVVSALTAAGGVGAFFLLRRRPGEAGEPGLAEELAAALEESLDDLRDEADPRRAVIGAYARMERIFAARGLPRRPAETPLEFTARVLTGLEASAASVARLADLFERAKFSRHEIGGGMKAEAIAALTAVRDELA